MSPSNRATAPSILRPAPLETGDAALVERVRAGDEAAFTVLLRTHGEALVRYANCITRSPEAAEEVVQDVLFEVWRHRERLVVTVSLRHYLYGAVRNRALNVSQRAKRRERLLEPVRREAIAANTDGVSEADALVRADEIDNAMRRAIDRLPPQCGTAYAYHWYEGLSHRQIAERMGLAVKTVERHLGLALKSLRRQLSKVR